MKSSTGNRNDYCKQNKLTTEELKKYPGFENMSDEELEEQLSGILQLASILVEIHFDQNNHEQRTA